MTTTYEQERTEEARVIDSIILERVKAGIAWLEETHGPGWEDKIDLDSFEIRCPDSCVLGQVYRDNERGHTGYSWAVMNLIDRQFRESMVTGNGFGITGVLPDDPVWRELQQAWLDALTPRVSNHSTPKE